MRSQLARTVLLTASRAGCQLFRSARARAKGFALGGSPPLNLGKKVGVRNLAQIDWFFHRYPPKQAGQPSARSRRAKSSRKSPMQPDSCMIGSS
jgi:hypothetical protein